MNLEYLRDLEKQLKERTEFVNYYKQGIMQGPNIEDSVAKATKEIELLSKKIEVSKKAIQLVNHRKAKEIVSQNPGIFRNVDEKGDIDFNVIEDKIEPLREEANSIGIEKQRAAKEDNELADVNAAKSNYESIVHNNERAMEYLNELDPQKVAEFYEKKNEYIQAVKENQALLQALEVKPKGIFARIKFALNYNKRYKESKNASEKVSRLLSEMTDISKEIKAPEEDITMEHYQGKKDPAFKELNDLGYGYTTINLGSKFLVGNSLEDAKKILAQKLAASPELANALAKYNQKLQEKQMTPSQLSMRNADNMMRKMKIQKEEQSLGQKCYETTGNRDLASVENTVMFVRQNILPKEQEENVTNFLREPKNNAILKKIKGRLFAENTRNHADIDVGDDRR